MKALKCPICRINNIRCYNPCHHDLDDGYKVVYWCYVNIDNETEVWKDNEPLLTLKGLVYLDLEKVMKLLVLK